MAKTVKRKLLYSENYSKGTELTNINELKALLDREGTVVFAVRHASYDDDTQEITVTLRVKKDKILGHCKECTEPVRESALIPDRRPITPIYECLNCGHPHTIDELIPVETMQKASG